MPPYDDVRSSTVSYASGDGGGRWDAERFSREREERMYGRGPPVRERSRGPPFGDYERRRDDGRFVERARYVEEDRFAPRRRERFVEEDDFYASRGSGALVRRPEELPPRPPRLIRRQSSLDTFDRIPARRVDRAPPITGVQRAPRHPPSPVRYERDVYEEIDIAEPDYYGDEEFRHFEERERMAPRAVREELVREKVVEKPYPRKGKTKVPRKLVHPRAVQELGYPYFEEDRFIVIQKALSKELIDEIVSRSREVRRRSESVTIRKYEVSPSPPRAREREVVEEVVVDRSPRRHERLVVERSTSRHRSPSFVRGGLLSPREVIETRPRSVSATYRRPASPVFVERPYVESNEIHMPLSLVERPRRSERDVREEIRVLEDERRVLQLERHPEILQLERRPEGVGSVDIIKDRIVERSDGERDEFIEVKKDRKAPDSRILRAMMATLT